MESSTEPGFDDGGWAETSAVLLVLRLKGFAPGETLARSTGLPVERVERVLDQARTAGWAHSRSGTRSGWTLTSTGRSAIEARLSEDLDRIDVRSRIEAAYARFLELNQALLATCTRWQVKQADPVMLNHHDDADYDRRVIEELRALDLQAGPVCDELSDALDRYGGYRPRLTHALARIDAGELDWFTRPIIDSYHTVWFELHEDLLVTLGRDRTSEQQSGSR